MTNQYDKWSNFLNPDNLKGNLISSSLYIATYESFKQYIINQVKYFFHTGFDESGDRISIQYKNEVLSKDKSVLFSSLLWLKEQAAIDETDVATFNEIRKFRNKLAHEMMDLLFDGMDIDFPKCYTELKTLSIKVEKWWILNIDIPTNPDFNGSDQIKQEEIVTSSEILYQIINDILSGDEKTNSFYRDEILSKYK